MTIENTLKEAADQLAADPIGALSLPMRTKIWNACHEIVGDEHYLAFYAKLNLERLEHVRFMRDASYPNDTAVDELISITKKIFSSEISFKEAERIAGKYRVEHVENAAYTPATEPAIYVAAAACSTVNHAAYTPEEYEYDPYDGALDTDLDAYGFEPNYWAACAYCTEINWEESSEAVIAKRREYWEWYLTKAVPHALETYQELYEPSGS